MVQFNPEGYIIIIETSDPIEDWLEVQSEIIRLMVALESIEDGMDLSARLHNFLREMQPDIEVAKRMLRS